MVLHLLMSQLGSGFEDKKKTIALYSDKAPGFSPRLAKGILCAHHSSGLQNLWQKI